MGAADLNLRAEIAMAYTEAIAIERRLASGHVSVKRRKGRHVTVRALRVYAAYLETLMDRDADPAAIKAANGGGCSRAPVSADQSCQEASVVHAPTNAGTWIPDAEEIAQLSEEGLRGDD